MSDVKRCPCRGSNEMCGCQNGPHPVRQDPEAEITALRARLEAVEKERDQVLRRENDANVAAFNHLRRAERAEAALATAHDVDIIEQAMNDIFAEGGDVRAAAEYVSQTIRALANEAET